jgi:uncharacterized integral membrane protein
MWLKIKVWTKVVLFGILFLYSLIFIFKNSDKTADFWYWPGRPAKYPTLFLTIGSFLAGVIVVVLLRTTFKTLQQVRELQSRSRSEKLTREVELMKQKTATLRTADTATASATISPTSSPSDPAV